jgi:hypothetical protein
MALGSQKQRRRKIEAERERSPSYKPSPVPRGEVDLLRKNGEFPMSDEELDDTAATFYEGI